MAHLIRSATLNDAARIAEIYSHYVLHTPISFEVTPPSREEIHTRMAGITSQFPYLVYELDGQVVGYAYCSTHNGRCAYAWSVDASVYLDHRFHGRGIGKKLYQTLFTLVKAQGAINVFAGITLPNAASVGLHESMGFKLVGVYRDVGYKMGSWHDVGWWQLMLGRPAGAPGDLKNPDATFLFENP